MKRIPIIPTLLVLAAVAVMVALGVWQARKIGVKRDLIAQFQANTHLPPTTWPTMGGGQERILYRRATGFCVEVVGWRAVAGRSRANEPGWSHIAACRTGGLEGPGMQVDIGWSTSSKDPSWKGGEVTGLAIALELAASPPFWLHILLWLPLTSAAVILSLRAAKGLLLALEYRHRAAEGRIASDE